jgi:hypothetical protein
MAGAHEEEDQHKQSQDQTTQDLLARDFHYCPP